VRLLIWDFDGTLGYRQGGFTASLLAVIQRELPGAGLNLERLSPYMHTGFPWHQPEVDHAYVTGADAWWAMLEPVFERALLGEGVESAIARRLSRMVRGEYVDLAKWRTYDDVEPALTRLSQLGWTHVLLSNHVPELGDIVRYLGLDRRLDRVFNSAETGYEKPNPEAYARVLRAYPQARVVRMAGDSYSADIRGAEAAGIPAILVRREHVEAERWCHSLNDVPLMLEVMESIEDKEDV